MTFLHFSFTNSFAHIASLASPSYTYPRVQQVHLDLASGETQMTFLHFNFTNSFAHVASLASPPYVYPPRSTGAPGHGIGRG